MVFQPFKVEGYTMKEELGQGSFGIVYKASNKQKETVAIKLLQNLPKSRKFTQRELEIIDQDLDHENIVSITEHFVFQGRIYIVMEFCEGGDLNDYIIKNEPKLKERFNLMTDMARGVLYLHSQNIVHRDLKHENVLLTNTGQRYICKITDFGLSRIMEHKYDMFSTHCGSPPYFAPEVIEGRAHAKPIDIFALGLIYFAVYKLSIAQNSFGERVLVPAKISSEKNYDFLNFVLRNEQPSESKFILDFFHTSEEMGRLIYSMVRWKPDERSLIDKVLIRIVEEKVRHDFTGGNKESVEREISDTTWAREQENRISDLEAKINDQEATISAKEDKIRNLEHTIEDILQQNAVLRQKINKHKSSEINGAKIKQFSPRKAVGGSMPEVC